MAKYRLLRERVLKEGVIAPEDLEVPPAATDEQLLLAHTHGYLEKVRSGTLDRKEQRRIGFPWSEALVERSRRSVGGTLAACRVALEEGVAANLAGGTHHAFSDRGEGFCVFNDAAVASRVLQEEGLVEKVLILDCDVHQGNGTASLFREDPSVFTFSMHGRKNFPFHKERGDLDVELEDGTADEIYLSLLEQALTRTLTSLGAGLVIYLAGADPYEGDRFGRLSLTLEGLAERDRKVFSFCRDLAVPVAVVMAGGYARNVDAIVDIHLQTLHQAAKG